MRDSSGDNFNAARIEAEGALWPWIARFFWAPAADLHPSRRDTAAPGLPPAAWSQPTVLRHLSRHLLQGTAPDCVPVWNSAEAAFRIALLPAIPLEILARRMGLALVGGGADHLQPGDEEFLTKRAPLYWVARTQSGADREAVGWGALSCAMEGQSESVRARFDWKTPVAMRSAESYGSSAALLVLATRILRELEEPWSCLFVTRMR